MNNKNENRNHIIEHEIKSNRYFQDALSDFTYDAASGRAIRHLASAGFTAEQILHQLDYPTPLTKIRKTITRYLMENGTLRDELPVLQDDFKHFSYHYTSENKIFSCLSKYIDQNEKENSYISCPFGILYTDNEDALTNLLLPLTAREREYITGIIWEPKTMYHRLDRRMLEIGVQLAMNSDLFFFYFIKSHEIIHVY